MAGQKPIQLILARQLASSLAMPIIIVDTEGTLVYYNERAETLIGRRFEETGEMAADKWGAEFDVEDEDRNPVPRSEWPLVVALTQRKPVSQVCWLKCPDGETRHLNWTFVPFIAQNGEYLGVQGVFWEV